MSLIFKCSESQVKELILKNLKGAEKESGIAYDNLISNLKNEIEFIEISDSNSDFTPSTNKLIDKILWQLIAEQIFFLDLKSLQDGRIIIRIVK